jgi:hypothetical protein
MSYRACLGKCHRQMKFPISKQKEISSGMTSQIGEISGSNGGEYEDSCHLGYCVVKTGTSLPMFQRCLLLLSSGRF